MAINLNKHRDELATAWKDVLNEKTATNWALFGYEGQTNDLKVVSKGSGGLEELSEDLNSGKIMYAFVKIEDPKTSLYKCVLINWQGEGANTVRKGICANHLRDVENFFAGAHLTISARNEDEVEPDLIVSKVAMAGSAYSFKTTKIDNSGPTVPIGSTYKRVNPVKEINPAERDQFWMKEEEEEKKRLEEERARKEVDKLKREEEVKQRETLETAQREAKSVERNNQIAQIKEAERLAQETEKKQDVYVEEVVKVNHSDVLRQQRKLEAQELIAQRTIDARSVFEKNTSAGQMKKVPEKPVRNSLIKAQQQQSQTIVVENKAPIIQTVVEEKVVQQETKIIEEPPSDEETDQYSTIKRSPRDAEKKAEFASVDNFKNGDNNQKGQNFVIKEPTANTQMQHITEQQFVDEVIYQDFSEGPGLQARALYDYQAADDTEITFDPGQIITNIDQVDEGWWQGLGPDGTYGLFPANYVEIIN